MKTLTLVVSLPFFIAMGIAAHALLAAAIKTVCWAWAPLARGELEVATYQRRVYHTADGAVLQVIGAAAVSGLLAWAAAASGSWLAWSAPLLALGGTIALDLRRWERVSASAEHLWFQRGLGHRVHQLHIANIRDLQVEQTPVAGFTLRHGGRNELVRLKLRLRDRRVVALPKTEARRGLADVERVAAHVRARQQLLAQQAAKRGAPAARPAPLTVPGVLAAAMEDNEDDLRRTLRRLRRRDREQRAPTPSAGAGPAAAESASR